MTPGRRATRRTTVAARRKAGHRRVAGVLAAAAGIAAGTQAYGAPVLWFNPPVGHPDHFDWGVPGATRGLDVTRGPSEQPATAPGPAVFDQFVHATAEFSGVDAPSGGGVEVGGYGDYFLLPHFPSGWPWGGLIPSGAPWRSHAYISYPGFEPLFPEGQRAYLALRFDPGDGVHYAWVGVERSGPELEAFAWLYETDPGIPVCYPPEPAALALLALGAAAVATRGRAARSGEETKS